MSLSEALLFASKANVNTAARSRLLFWLANTTMEAAQPAPRTVSACRNKSQSPLAAFDPAINWGPRPFSQVITRAPSFSARQAVSSVELASATINSSEMPAFSAVFRAVIVAFIVLAALYAGIITERLIIPAFFWLMDDGCFIAVFLAFLIRSLG